MLFPIIKTKVHLNTFFENKHMLTKPTTQIQKWLDTDDQVLRNKQVQYWISKLQKLPKQLTRPHWFLPTEAWRF